MKKKTALWRGLTSILCMVLALSIILGSVLEANAGAIDTYLGTLSSRVVSENPEDLYVKFVPDDEYLNEDDTGNSAALIEAAIDLGRREAAEGSVLLKNNGALPLSEGSAVTLLGIRSHSNLIGSSFGVKAQGPFINLEQALSKNITDFNIDVLKQNGLISGKDRIKILGRGELSKAVNVTAHAFSETAKKAIEEKGGVATVIE